MKSHIVFRVFACPNGSGLAIPLRMFAEQDEEAAKAFMVKASEELGQMLGTYMVVAPSPRGPVAAGTFKDLLMELLNGPFALRHQLVVMETTSDLELPTSGLVAPSGRPL